MEIRATDLKGRTVLMAVSGGLDSCTITHWLARQGVGVIAYTADLGQPDEDDIEDVRSRMLACGAKEAILDDLRPEIAAAGLRLIQASARYEGGYWNTTAIARHVVVAGMIPVLRRHGVGILGHGCTGRGNDQVRFELAGQMLDPDIGVYAPWRDPGFLQVFGGRRQMIDYCSGHGLPIRATRDSPYSTDANMLGLTHEAGELEDLATPASRIDPGMGVFPVDAANEPETVDIHFESGLPVKVGQREVDPVGAIETCNEIAGRNGVGIGLHTVENRFVGIKSRGVYEAPGMELLGRSYEYLLQLILDRRCRRLYDQISAHIAEQIYQGYGFDTATRASWAFMEQLSRMATGTISSTLYKGNVFFRAAADAPHSLYDADTSSMEEIGEFDHRDSQGFLGVLGVSARALNHAGQSGVRDV